MGRNPHEETARAGGKPGYGPSDTGGGDAPHLRTKTTFNPKKAVTADGTGKVISAVGYATNINPIKALGTAITWGKNLFQNKAKVPTVEDTAAMEDAPFNQQKKMYDWGPQNGGEGIAGLRNTGITQSLASTPTADVNTRHQWGFKAYPGTPGTTYDPKTYAKQGKMIRKYGTGQEVKNFSKGKRFGPPPLKGPDPQGLQTVLESSDYFKKLIG
jgi:hypothetical protein